MNMIALSDMYDAPLEPSAINFTASSGRSCRNCLYQRQRVSVCNKAVEVALRAGLASCDDNDVVYVLKEIDTRQLTIQGE